MIWLGVISGPEKTNAEVSYYHIHQLLVEYSDGSFISCSQFSMNYFGGGRPGRFFNWKRRSHPNVNLVYMSIKINNNVGRLLWNWKGEQYGWLHVVRSSGYYCIRLCNACGFTFCIWFLKYKTIIFHWHIGAISLCLFVLQSSVRSDWEWFVFL